MKLRWLRMLRWWIEYNLAILHDRECRVRMAIAEFYRRRKSVDAQIDRMEYEREMVWEDTQ